MTAAQTAKYFAEWGQLRDVLRARGLSSAQCEQQRSEVTLRALGFRKSSKEFTNAEFDRVLAQIAAERAPTDFAAQMRLQEQPERRISLLIGRVEALAGHLDLPTHYVDGISRRMFGEQYHNLPERALQQVEGILRRKLRSSQRTAEQIAEIERQVAAEAAGRLKTLPTATPAGVAVGGEDEGDPF